MVPTPEESTRDGAMTTPDNPSSRIVISGISGLFPEARNVQEFSDILYSKRNPVTCENLRWDFHISGVSPYCGKVPDLDRFDAQFFRVHFRLGQCIDPMARKMLEQAYQAIYDAGVNPSTLWGKKIGVFVGTGSSESEKAWVYTNKEKNGFGISGCNKAMFANRVSYNFNLKGPSMSIDAACCSSMIALEQACRSIYRGDSDAAVVGGCFIGLHPHSYFNFSRSIKLSKDKTTKSFDKHADGVAKSEAVSAIFIQRAEDALRVYADLIHVKSEFLSAADPYAGLNKNPEPVIKFLKQFYEDAKVPPQAIEYVEASGMADPEVDKVELEVIDKVFCQNRNTTLAVGSVTSNIGYTEAASGINGIIKVLLGYHKGLLAGNIHYTVPRDDVPALREGRLRVLSDHQPSRRQYIAVSNMAFTGIHAQALLHGHYKPKDTNRYKTGIPRLITLSARQSSGVQAIIDELKSHPVDPEVIALLHKIHENNINGHYGRGFAILDCKSTETVCLSEKAENIEITRRPLWFVYSGMGSQWPGMGTQLMRIPVFAAAIERCRVILEPKGLDIVKIITSPERTTFDNILHSFVGIAAIQIGLTDVLTAVGLKPDKIIGHSVGELGCAYADGCFTTEEMILAAYSRGMVSQETPFIRGSMAAVGIGYQKVSKMCPPEIEVACHNGPDSATISGPATKMREFVEELTAQGIFAKEVPCSNIAFHSSYIAEGGPSLRKRLEEVIREPKPRSDRWVSTSVPQERWHEQNAKYSGAEYHTNNLLSPVLFEETSQLIPFNAVLVEIAPHGLLQAILKRSLPETCTHVPLTRRGHNDSVTLLLQALGNLYVEGYSLNIKALYPKIEFPVSTGTPHLSHLIEWNHDEKWFLPLTIKAERKYTTSCNHLISLHNDSDCYLRGNVIRGKTAFPFAGVLVAVWDTISMILGSKKNTLSIRFQEVTFYSEPLLFEQQYLQLSVAVNIGTRWFEVLAGTTKVATGYIFNSKKNSVYSTHKITFENKEVTLLTSDEVYKLLLERDYEYSGEFRSIESANVALTKAKVEWRNNWVTLLDGLFQLNTLRQAHDTVSRPSYISKLSIDIKTHYMQSTEEKTLNAEIFECENSTRCGGVVINDIRFDKKPLSIHDPLALKTLKFVPRFTPNNTDLGTIDQIVTQIVAENVNKDVIKVVEILNYKHDISMLRNVTTLLEVVSNVKVNSKQVCRDQVIENPENILYDVDFILVRNLSTDNDLTQILNNVLRSYTFVMNAESTNSTNRERPEMTLTVVSAYKTKDQSIELMLQKPINDTSASTAVTLLTYTDLTMVTASRNCLMPQQNLVILSFYPLVPGIKELVKQWRKESSKNQVFLAISKQDITQSQELNQLPEFDLAFNVLDQDSVWGGEYFVPIEEQSRTTEHDAMLQCERVGDLDSLCWIPTEPELTGPGITVNVHFSGLNFFDAKRATGTVPFENDTKLSEFGMDFSGLTDSGSRVMGICSGGSTRRQVRVAAELTWPVPAHWTLEDAATVPLPYAHAFYLLFIKCKLQRGMSVLIHGGAGALGQAAISIALAHGCCVFVTVSDVHKKKFLRRIFPDLPAERIGNSRDVTFSDMVLLATNGEGCNIIIGSVRVELKNASVRCCDQQGITIDTSEIHNTDKFIYGMFNLSISKSYFLSDISSVIKNHNFEEIKKLQVLVSEGISRGYVRPLSRVTYAPDEAPRAFRLLAASRHRGRVLLHLHQAVLPPVRPRILCSADKWQVVLCDDDGFGLLLADRLVRRGARLLRIHLFRPSAHTQFKIQSWQSLGVRVDIQSDDLIDSNSVNKLVDMKDLKSVEGIYVVATNKKNPKELNHVVDSLDRASRKLCESLKYFAVVASGNLDYLYHIFEFRAQDNLPSTILKIPSLKNVFSSKTGEVSWRSALDATEQALTSSHTSFLAHIEPTTGDFLSQFFDITGVDLHGTEESLTLRQLGLTSDALYKLSAWLSMDHNFDFTEDQLMSFTVQKLKSLEHAADLSENNTVQGIEPFFTVIQHDEVEASKESRYLTTLVCDDTWREEEFTSFNRVVCVVPGLEGNAARFKTLAASLPLPAYFLAPRLYAQSESLADTAARIVQVILQETVIKKKFYLLGYEQGVPLALEVAAIFEDIGLTGTVFLLGLPPDEWKTELEARLSLYKSEEELQDAVIRRVSAIMCGDDFLEGKLRETAGLTWPEKVLTCVRSLRGHFTHSEQYARSLIEAMYARLCQARQSVLKPRSLRSRLVLIRASSVTKPTQSLQIYTQQPVVEYNLPVSLHRLTSDLRCAAIINRHIRQEAIQEYESQNLCESYLLNQGQYLMTID